MLNNTITLQDSVPNSYTFDLVSRAGMTSIRRETTAGVSSSEGSVLKISNTVDLNAPNTKNRHLVQLSWTDYDATTNAPYQASVHVIVSRHKMVTDAKILAKLQQLADFFGTEANVTDLLRGGN